MRAGVVTAFSFPCSRPACEGPLKTRARRRKIRARRLTRSRACATLSYMDTLTIRIPKPLRRDLERLARSSHQPMSDLVRDSLRQYVAERKFRALREAAIPFAQAQGFLTDEDVFKVVS